MEKKPSRVYALRITEDVEKDIKIIMNHTNIQDYANAIRYAIGFTKMKLEPIYHSERKEMTKRVKYDNPIDKVAAELEKKKEKSEAKHAFEMQRGMNICELLEGEIINQENGFTACKFTTYDINKNTILTGSRTIPLEDLHESHVERQYRGGTKEEAKALLSKQK